MTAVVNWRPFLERVSREILADPDQRGLLPPEAVASGWLGFPPATLQESGALEQRLGVRLPESYRSFLLMTNGFRTVGHSMELLPLLPASEVMWFREKHQDWLDAWEEGARSVGGPLPTVSDEDYFVYGPGQDPCKFRLDYWRATLAIAGTCGVWTYLLNPLVVTPDGEWEAWLFVGEGPYRYRTFWELMHAELETFVKLRENPDKP